MLPTICLLLSLPLPAVEPAVSADPKRWELALERAPRHPLAAYELACAAARRGQKQAALQWLDRAAKWGYDAPAVARWDKDLKGLRGQAGFERVLKSMEPLPSWKPVQQLRVMDGGASLGRPGLRGDGRSYVVGTDTGSLRWIRTGNGKQQRVVELGEPVLEARFSVAGSLAVQTPQRTLVWAAEPMEGGPDLELPNRTSSLGEQAMEFHPAAPVIACLDGQGCQVRQIDPPRELFDVPGRWRGMAWSPDGRKLVLVETSHRVQVLEARTGKLLHRWQGEGFSSSLAISRGGHWLALSSTGPRASLRALHDGEVWRGFPLRLLSHADLGKRSPVTLVELDDLGQRAISAAPELGSLRAWDLVRGRRLWAMKARGGATRIGARLLGERVFVSMGLSDPLVVDFDTGRTLAEVPWSGAQWSVGPEPSGSWVLADERATGVVDAGTGRLRLRRIEGGEGAHALLSPQHFVATQAWKGSLPIEVRIAEGSQAYRNYRELLHDPKRVAAALEGVSVPPARLPALPVVLNCRLSRDGRLEVRARGPQQPPRLEVYWSRGQLPARRVRAATHATGEREATLQLQIPRDLIPAGETLQVRAIGASGQVSDLVRAGRLAVRE